MTVYCAICETPFQSTLDEIIEVQGTYGPLHLFCCDSEECRAELPEVIRALETGER